MGALLQWPAACGEAGGALPPILVDPVDSRPAAWGGHVMEISTLFIRTNMTDVWLLA